MKNAGAYAKSLIPLLITALYSIQAALSDGKVTSTEWGGIATGLLASLGAFLVPNCQNRAGVVQQPTVTVSQPANVNAAATTTTVTEPAPPIL